MTNAAFSSDPIADLWREARSWLAAALRAFHGAAEIARTLAHEARALIRRRLMRIESLVMKLLLIEAAAHPIPRARVPSTPARTTKAHARRSATPEDPARPETWRVRFHLRIPKPPRAPAQANPERRARLRAQPGAETARAQIKATRLARRFEALRRVLADPRRAVARLARLLHALGRAARACARRIALAHPPRTQRLGPALANAIVYGCDASLSFAGDTS